MAPKRRNVTDAELAVLKIIWTRDFTTTREITDELYPGGTATHYATVQKLLERLEAKDCVRRDRSRHVHVFSAAAAREDLIGHGLKNLAERLCNGAMGPLLTCLVENRKLSRRERAELRRILEGEDSNRRTSRNRPGADGSA